MLNQGPKGGLGALDQLPGLTLALGPQCGGQPSLVEVLWGGHSPPKAK